MTLSNAHIEWLANRKLALEIAEETGLHSDGKYIAIPYRDADGQEVYAKLRNPADKSDQLCKPSGVTQQWLYREDTLPERPEPRDVLIICEGEFDALACLAAGYPHVVSVPAGAAATEAGARSKAIACLVEKTERGEFIKPKIDSFRRILIAVDCDQPGLLLRKAIIDVLDAPDRICLPTYPEGCKDANDVLVRHGQQALAAMIDRALPLEDDGYIDALSLASEVKPMKPITTGIEFLQPYVRWVRPEFVIVAGAPGSGKSTFMTYVALSTAWHNPEIRLAMFNAEGDKSAPARYAAKFWNTQRNDLNPGSEQARIERDAWIRERVGVMRPRQDEQPTFKWLLRAIEQQILYRGRNFFIVDPWNEITFERKPGELRTDAIGDAIIALKALSERYGVVIVVLHHTKANDRRFRDMAPTMDDIADSVNFSRKADHVILCWRPLRGRSCAQIIIDKSKHHNLTGQEGAVWIELDTVTFSLRQLDQSPLEELEVQREIEKKRKKDRVADAMQSLTDAIADSGELY